MRLESREFSIDVSSGRPDAVVTHDDDDDDAPAELRVAWPEVVDVKWGRFA